MILGEPIVFFRTQDGTPVAFEDRCAHRHLPLSMGKLVGDRLQCHYHGLQYDRTGRCVRIPGQEQIPPDASVKTYPVVERYHWLWIWMGDPALADPAKITDFHWLDDPGWGAKSSYLHVKSNWQLIVDNLLDLTHLAFVHETTIGNAALAEHATVKVTRAPNNVVVTRWIIDQPAPPTFVKVGGFTVQCRPLADHRLCAARVPAARRRRDPDRYRRAAGHAGRRHHHAQPQRHHAGDREDLALFLGPGPRLRRQERRADADRSSSRSRPRSTRMSRCSTAQQRNLNLIPDPPQIDINADTGVIQARRILDRLHGEEQAALHATAAE